MADVRKKKVKCWGDDHYGKFEDKMNSELEQMFKDGKAVVDIKYSVILDPSKNVNNEIHWGMIVYEE